KVFVDLYDQGLIYRDTYMVNWDPGLRSAISDLEVEDREGVVDPLYSIAYPLADGGGEVVVATVRPETMLADSAVAVHPDDERVAVIAALEAQGAIRGVEDYVHTVPYSQRSGERVEPLISLQWFMRMDELAAPAAEAVRSGRIRIHPESQRRRYLDWLDEI